VEGTTAVDDEVVHLRDERLPPQTQHRFIFTIVLISLNHFVH
jgi:hypothetical protein